MSRYIIGLAIGLALAGVLIMTLEYIKRSYNRGKQDEKDTQEFYQLLEQMNNDDR
jgi:hypothetical protein